MTVFKNYSHQTTINKYSGISFSYLVGFGYLVDSNTTHYVLDWSGNKIIIFDENWQYLTFQSFNNPAFMISVNNGLYISANNFIYKTDKYLNKTNQYYSASAGYRGLYFNSTNNTITVTDYQNKKIDTFYLNLSLVDSIPTPTYQPYSMQGYRNYIYVGTLSGHLLVIENRAILRILNVCNPNIYLTSILIDHFGYMSLSCVHDKKAYLYYSSNSSYTGMSLTYTVSPWYLNFDSNGRFVLISPYQIDINY